MNILPEDVKAETLRTFTDADYFKAVMRYDKERRDNVRKLLERESSEDESTSEVSSNEVEKAIADDDGIQTPSPVEQRLGQQMPLRFYFAGKISTEIANASTVENGADQSLEESKEEVQADQQLQLPEEESKEKAQATDQQLQLPEEPLSTVSEEPLRPLQVESQTNENPAKRNLSSSDGSDAGSGKSDMQRMRGEHGAVTRSKTARLKTARSIRWGDGFNSSGKEEAQSSSTAAALSLANKLATDQQQLQTRRGVSNNLRGTHDPVLGFGGKVKSLIESIRKDIFRTADGLRLPKGQESLVFHRGNFVDQNAVVRSANAYADFIIEDACGRGIPEDQRRISRGRDGRNAEGIPDNEIKQSVTLCC